MRVTADVTNTGGVAGDEVAQLYVGYRGSQVERAVRDLKGFARVHLEPGETRAVAFDAACGGPGASGTSRRPDGTSNRSRTRWRWDRLHGISRFRVRSP